MSSNSQGLSFGKKLIFGALTVLLTSTILVVLIEGLLGFAWPRPVAYMALHPNTQSIFNLPGASGVEGPSLYAVNSMGVRAREWSPNRASEYRILAMGGSTTECLVNDQDRVWTNLLEKELGTFPDGQEAWVGNIGSSGLNSRHHVIQMEHLLPVYDPDLILLLVGVNDLSVRLGRGEQYDCDFLDDPENAAAITAQAFASTPGQLPLGWSEDPWYKRSYLWYLLRLFKYQIFHQTLYQDSEGRSLEIWRDMRAKGRRAFELPSLDTALDEYERNLRKTVVRALEHGTKIILLTQPVLWRAEMTDYEKGLLWMGGVGEFRTEPGCIFYSPAALEKGMNEYNQRLIDMCRETGTPYFDLASQLPKTTEFLYDDCHFTDAAQVVISKLLTRAVIDQRESQWRSRRYRNPVPVSAEGNGRHNNQESTKSPERKRTRR